MNSGKTITPLLPRVSPFALLSSGKTAFQEVPGLRMFMVKGFILNYVVFLIVAFFGMGVVYYLIIDPLMAGLNSWSAGEGFFMQIIAGILKVILWIANILLMGATMVLSFLFSLAMLSLWFESLAGRIMTHWRNIGGELTGPEFSIMELLAGFWRSLFDSLVLLFLACLALALGFIPLIGPVLVIVIDSFLLGWEVRNPYLTVRESLGDDPKEMRKGLKLWTAYTGLLPIALAIIPIVGWALLPGVMIYMVAGVAWQGEQALAESKS